MSGRAGIEIRSMKKDDFPAVKKLVRDTRMELIPLWYRRSVLRSIKIQVRLLFHF